ncbi:MAG: hypothetical protein AAGI71_12140 [Bacteroidota bacterium]
MSTLVRSLLITAAATGVAAVVYRVLNPPTTFPPPIQPVAVPPPEIEADALSDEARQTLSDELASHL